MTIAITRTELDAASLKWTPLSGPLGPGLKDTLKKPLSTRSRNSL